MSTEQVSIFGGANAEYANLLSPNPTIDLTDSPVPVGIPTGIGSQLQGPGYYLTSTIPALGYNEIQFDLMSTLFGCNMQFGSSPCGVNIRQGIAHMIDKSIFASSDPGISVGTGIPMDNPVPTNAGGGLLSPDSCAYDNRNIPGWFNQTNVAGSLCSVGAGNGSNIGGSSYHFATAGSSGNCAGVSFAWQQCPGSPDLNEAAAHFVLAGVATGCDGGTGASSCLTSADSKLSGVIAPTCSTPSCSFFVRNDDRARLDLGTGLAATICYLLTGTYGTPGCAALGVTQGSVTTFPGFNPFACGPGVPTCCTSICASWGMYTAAYQGFTFYDGSLYFTYNSAFVSGIGSNQISGGGPCSNSAVPTQSPANYMFLCNSIYDTYSNQLEFSPCLSATGDPLAGATSNTPSPGICSTGQLSSHSAGVLAEAQFGQNVYTIPIFQRRVQFGYLQCQPPGPCSASNSWGRAINDPGLGLPSYFTWLNAFNPGPATTSAIRQGFDETTKSVNPYIASTLWDTFIEGNIYDSLQVKNPLSTTQFFNWMTANTQTLTSVSYNSGGVTSAPPGTLVTYRFVLRPDLTFQDGRPVTSYDVAFSYLSEVGAGAFLGISASMMTGVTILNPIVFDIGVNSTGPFVLPNLTSIPIVPGHYWTNAGPSSWDSAINACVSQSCQDVQYTLSGSTVNCKGACTNFPSSLMTINPSDLSATFDPSKTSMLIGSGPWQCGTGTSLGANCYTGTGANGASSYTLTAYTNYFRSSERLAIYLWSGESDINAIGPATAVGACFNVAVNLAGPCGHYQQGIGNPGSGSPVSVTTVGNVDIFFDLNWVSPFEWTTSPPTSVAPLNPVLYGLVPFDGSTSYMPNPGGTSCTVPNTYYDC
jgi:hypothetical protein